jgi:transitional endoplasmic reticulum ATPase
MSGLDPLSSPLLPEPLRAALKVSPANGPLLEHAADTVLKNGGFAEAEVLFKRALAINGHSLAAKLGLSQAFAQQGKQSTALVIVEDLVQLDPPPPAALLLHARLAWQSGDARLAARQYSRARELNPLLVDDDLEQKLGAQLAPRPAPSLPAKPPAPTEEHEVPDFGASESREALPAGDLPAKDAAIEVERPDIDFSAVGGMDRVKEEIRMKIILPLRQPDLFKAYGKKAGGGILLYGPPGCGKTYLARATAGEVKSGFLSVGISDVLDMWIGQSEKNLHAIFEQARSHRPCVLFFDEVDALGANRTDMLKSAGRQIINQFLAELDGVQSSNEGVLVLAATNAPWHLDSAFRRPGRFDRILFVPPPDAPARAAILRLQLKGRPVEALDFDQLAAKTEGFSGADLKAVVDQAVEACLREAMKSGAIRPISGKDLLAAAKQHRPTVRDWFETARNYALYANQSGLYDDILAHLKISK